MILTDLIPPACKDDYNMSDLDVRALEANFQTWHDQRVSEMHPHKAFEFFVADQLLKDVAELSDEDLRVGMLTDEDENKGDDGGVDSMYFFINKMLIQDETEPPASALEAELIVIQSKFEKSFTETAVQKIEAFMRDLLNYAKPAESFTYLNVLAQNAIANFRNKYDAIAGQSHKFKITLAYATKSADEPHKKVYERADNVKSFVREKFSAAEIDFKFWGAKILLAKARESVKRTLPLKTNGKILPTDDGSVVCLVTLKEFAGFLTNEQRNLRGFLLEPNVRDYAGKSNPVNTDIRLTLESDDQIEFWWLNNGITVLATKCPLEGNTLAVEQPEIVNGLQTSQEIYHHFKANPEKTDNRNLLVRIIIATDEPTRNKIIKATNFQTPVNPLSLHATDIIHFDIQDRLQLYGLFYDRRKGYYKNLKKPMADIISMLDAARVIIAVVLQRPDDARARPQSLTKKEDTYKKIFNENYNKDLYPACILLDRQVKAYLKNETSIYAYEQGDLRYYVDMLVACELTQTAHPTPERIASLVPQVLKPIEKSILQTAYKTVYARYEKLGANPYTAKSPGFRLGFIRDLETRFSLTETTNEKEN